MESSHFHYQLLIRVHSQNTVGLNVFTQRMDIELRMVHIVKFGVMRPLMKF